MFCRTAAGVRGVGAAMRRDRRSTPPTTVTMASRSQLFAVTVIMAGFAADGATGMADFNRRDRAVRFAFGRRPMRRARREQGDRFRGQMWHLGKLEDGARGYGERIGGACNRDQPVARPGRFLRQRNAMRAMA